MIGSLLKEIPSISEAEEAELTVEPAFEGVSEEPLMSALPVVESIIRRKRISWRAEPEDLEQGVFLRLLKWLRRYRTKSEQMSPEEWKSFVATTTRHELNRHYKETASKLETSLDSAADVIARETIEGQTEAETCSLAKQWWQKICSLSVRQRQSLILGRDELVVYFMRAGVTDEELAESLGLTKREWEKVKDRIPLKFLQIGAFLKETGHEKSVEEIAISMKKARSEARQKVQEVRAK